MEIRAYTASGDRRGNPRHTGASIIYVELGSGNGGIIVNLGIDGLAFQAACKLTVEAESTLNLRLHGAGLNCELAGDIVWLGATQKEAGICFKSISAKAKQDIRDWIARHGQITCSTPAEEQSPLNPNPAPHPMSASADSFVSDSPFNAPAVPTATSATIPSRADADSKRWRLIDSVNSPAVIGGRQDRNADRAISQEPARIERSSIYRQRLEASRGERPYESVTDNPSSIASRSNGETRKNVQASPASPPKTAAAEKWLPKELFTGWKRTNSQQTLMLASAATAGVCILVLILTLRVGRVASPLNRPPRREFVQQTGATPTASSFANESYRQTRAAPIVSQTGSGSHPQTDSVQVTPVAPRVRTRPTPKSTALFKGFSDFFLGSGLNQKTSIDAHQDHVQVWVSKRSGYYYCADTPYYEKLLPGAAMAQGLALQSGYQPRLGEPCD
jgi:PilZ domain